MIENALSSKYDAIIVYKYDRFIRDNIEDQSLIRKLEQRGVNRQRRSSNTQRFPFRGQIGKSKPTNLISEEVDQKLWP